MLKGACLRIHGVLWTVLVLAILPARADEVTKSTVNGSAPERFHTALSVSGEGRASLLFGETAVTLSKDGRAAGTLKLSLPVNPVTLDCYFEKGAADIFLDGRYQGTVKTGAPGGFPVGIEAEGSLKVEGVKFIQLPPVYFRDDFMRGYQEAGTWRYSGARLQVVSEIRPDKSASPFRLECRGQDSGEIRTGNALWRGYSTAGAFLLGRGPAKAAIGTHLRNDTGLWAELSSDGRFTVKQGTLSEGKVLFETIVPVMTGEWHEIALNPTEAAIDGAVHPLKNVSPLPGGEAAMRISGKGTSVDDVRVESTDGGLKAFLDDFWAEPEAIRDSFQKDDEMVEWARGRFLWDVADNKKASFHYPVFGDRGVVIGGWSGGDTSLMVRPASGAAFSLSIKATEIEVKAWIGDKSGETKIARGSEAAFLARKEGLYAGDQLIVKADKSWEPKGGVNVDLIDGRWPSSIRVQAVAARDFTFSRAPAEFVPVSGEWSVSSRWRCSPELTWFAGKGDPAHVVYRHPLEGDGAIALAIAPGMTVRAAPFYNWPMGCVIALSPDPIDPFAGVAYIEQGLTGPGMLYVKGVKVAEDTSFGRPFPPVDEMQNTFQKIHHHWDIIRITRDGKRFSAETTGHAKLQVEDEVVAKPTYLHILCPSKSLAVISRLFLTFEKSLPPDASAWQTLACKRENVSITVNGMPLPIVPPPETGPWAFSFKKAALPDGIEQTNGGAGFTMIRPGARWIAGVKLDKPTRIASISFKLTGGEQMHSALYLDTDIGPVRLALRDDLMLAPCHDLPPAKAGADGVVTCSLTEYWQALGTAPLVKGIYFGELDRYPEEVYAVNSHVPGRRIEIGAITIAPLEETIKAKAADDDNIRFLTAPLEVLMKNELVLRVDVPAIELARLGNPAGAQYLGTGSEMGYSDGSALVRRLGKNAGLYAINPRLGGPAGIWLYRGAIATNRVPTCAVKSARGTNYISIAWDLISGTPHGKCSISWMDNKTVLRVAGQATPLKGALNGWTLFDMTLLNDNNTVNGAALADANWYDSCENAALRIDGAAGGAALQPDEKVRVEGFTDAISYTLYSTSGELLEEGTSENGQVRPRTVEVMKGRYFMVLRHNNAERLVPVDLIPPGRGGQMATPFSAPSAAGKKPVAVLISDGPVSTFIDDGEGMTPLIGNRRGSFPTANPPDGWVEPAGRELDRLAGGLLVEMLDKPREGFYLVAQDSGFAGRPKVLRSAIALPRGAGASINQAGENYMDMVHMGLTGATDEYTQVEQFLSEEVDSVYLDPGDKQALIRGLSVSSPDERGMRLRFFNVPAGVSLGWSVSGPDGGNQGEPNWLKDGEVEAHFRIEGNPGTYRVTPFIKTAAETTSLKPIKVRVK